MKQTFSKTYQGLRVLVTGHTGFKGSWLSLWLSELGAEVYGYALEAPTTPSLFEDAKIQSALKGHEIGDVRDQEHVLAYMMQVQPHVVFHLAAQPLVRLSYREPVETYATNVMGTVHVLDAVRQVSSVRVCQVVTSDKCYENAEWEYAYRENDAMGGYDPYSNSKGCSELVVSSYQQSFFHPDRFSEHGVSLSSVRAGNVIGGGDWAEDRIIPDSIRALMRYEPIEIRNPDAIRPWQHVLEPLSGYLWLAAMQYREPARYATAWNFGPGYAGNISVLSIVKQVIQCWGSGTYLCEQKQHQCVHEAKFLKLDIAKAMGALNWQPVNTVQETIAMTVAWYVEQAKGDVCLHDWTKKQIQYYMMHARQKHVLWAKS